MPVATPRYSDTVVIGGGTAGAAIAGRLAERGDQSVLLLEAGPDYGARSDGRWPADLLDGRIFSGDTHDWGYTSAARAGQPDHRLHRAKVIGGCSSHNGCIALWGSRADYDGWAANGNPGWSMDEVLPFFQKADAALRVREFEPAEITPFHAACRDAMLYAGIPAVANLNDLDEDVGAGIATVNIQDGVRWNTALAYLDPVRDSNRLTVLGDTLVDKINMAGGRAASVNIILDGRVSNTGAGRIILCAGAYGSPTILLRSGIGSPGDLKVLDIVTATELPGVGRNLHDHPAISLRYIGTKLLSARMDAFVGVGTPVFAEQSLAKLRSNGCSEAFDLHIAPTSALEADRDGRWECALAVANMAPKSRGRIVLRSPDPDASPVIDTGYLSDPDDADLAVLIDGIEITRQIARHGPLADLIGTEVAESAALVSVETVRRSCLHYYHPVGTCKMGPASDSMAVVDAQGKVHGTDNLYVADASIMSAIPRANTNLPTLMLAEHVVHGLD